MTPSQSESEEGKCSVFRFEESIYKVHDDGTVWRNCRDAKMCGQVGVGGVRLMRRIDPWDR